VVAPTLAVPVGAGVRMLHVSGSPMASVACSVRAKGVGEPFSDMVTLVLAPSVMTGALLGTLTVASSVWMLLVGATPMWLGPPSVPT